jgi:hypothetical protein
LDVETVSDPELTASTGTDATDDVDVASVFPHAVIDAAMSRLITIAAILLFI